MAVWRCLLTRGCETNSLQDLQQMIWIRYSGSVGSGSAKAHRWKAAKSRTCRFPSCSAASLQWNSQNQEVSRFLSLAGCCSWTCSLHLAAWHSSCEYVCVGGGGGGCVQHQAGSCVFLRVELIAPLQLQLTDRWRILSETAEATRGRDDETGASLQRERANSPSERAETLVHSTSAAAGQALKTEWVQSSKQLKLLWSQRNTLFLVLLPPPHPAEGGSNKPWTASGFSTTAVDWLHLTL